MDYKKIDKLIMKYLIIIVVLLTILFNIHDLINLVSYILSAFNNLIFAGMLAYVLNIVMSRIETFIVQSKIKPLIKAKRSISILFSLLVIWAIIYSLLNLVIPELVTAIGILLETLPSHLDNFTNVLLNLFDEIPNVEAYLTGVDFDWKSILDGAINLFTSGFTNVIGTTFNIVTVIAGSLFNWLLIFVLAIYFLAEKERFIRAYHRLPRLYLAKKHSDRIHNIFTVTNQTFSSFISGQCIEAVILGTLCALGMIILKMPYAIMIGILVGTINIIPIIGAYIGGAIGIFMVFTIDPMLAIGFAIYLVILQQFESNVIYPRVVGNSVGLPGVYVLATVIVGGALAGVTGMFLGIPTVASIYKLTKAHIVKKEQEIKEVSSI